MNINMLLWTTSKCNLKCPLCMVQNTQHCYPEYEISMDEVRSFIKSSLDRGIHYEFITLTGGEPSIWSNLKEAVILLHESGITNHITLITNGTNPEAIFEIAEYLVCYAVSTTQCSAKNLEIFKNSGHKIIYNSGEHKVLPSLPFNHVLPAECCNHLDFLGQVSNQLHYIHGKVYYCCYVINTSNYVEITPDLVCDFEDDFISYFKDKKYDKEICRYCLCNEKVWRKLI